MSEELVRYELRDGVALITLNRRPSGCPNMPMCAALHAAWTWFALSAEDRAAAMTSADDAIFCAGADVNDPPANFLDAIPEVGIALAKPATACCGQIRGAATLTAFCDLCVAAENTRFVYPEAKIGATLGLVSAVVGRIPHKVAMELMLLGESIDAARAWQVGSREPCRSGWAADRGGARARQRISRNAPLVLATLKQFARETLPRSPVETYVAAKREIDAVARSADMREGISGIPREAPAPFSG